MANNISKSSLNEINHAYQILKETGHALYYRDLISQVLLEKGGMVRPQAQVIAEIHTQINMDSRFVHTGKSMWGLTEWSPQRIGSREQEETAAASQEGNRRREKLLAAIQQDFDADQAGAAVEEPAGLLESGDELEDDEEELDSN